MRRQDATAEQSVAYLQADWHWPVIRVQTIEVVHWASLVHVTALHATLLLALGAHQVSELSARSQAKPPAQCGMLRGRELWWQQRVMPDDAHPTCRMLLKACSQLVVPGTDT